MSEYGIFMTHIFPYNRNIWVRENPYSGKFYVVKVSNQSFYFISSNKISANLELRLRVDALIIS